MDWVNIHIAKQIRSPAAIGSAPAELGTWVRVLAYCCEQENGGRIAGGAAWKDRQWQQTCAVTIRELRAADRLIRFDGADIVVNGYPVEKEQQVQANRLRASSGAMAKWGKRSDASATRAQRLSQAREKGRHTTAQWEEMRRHFGCCVRCGNTDQEIVKDHIRPIYQGGSDGIENIQPLCLHCNSSKGSENKDWRITSPKGCRPEWLTPAVTPATSRHLGSSQTPAEGEVGRGSRKGEASAAAPPPAQASTADALGMDQMQAAPKARAPKDDWPFWRQTHPRTFIGRSDEDGSAADWRALFARAGSEVMDAMYAALVPTLANPRHGIGYRAAVVWIDQNAEDE